MSAQAVWRSEGPRVDVTFSLATRKDAAAALGAVRAALEPVDAGYTAVETIGGWRGAVEPGYTVSLIGGRRYTARVVSALHGAGCTAVQVETIGWSSSCPYMVEEWRAADNGAADALGSPA